MYDFSKIKEGTDVTVFEVINELSKLPQNAKLVICGDNHFLIHTEEDGSVVNLDTNYMEDEYKDFDFCNIPRICPIEFIEQKQF